MTENGQQPEAAEAETQTLTLADEMKQAFKQEVSDDARQSTETDAEAQNDEGAQTGDEGEASNEQDGQAQDTLEDELGEEVEREFPLIPNEMSDEEKEIFQSALDSEDPEVQTMAQLFLERYNNLKKGYYAKAEEAKKLRSINEVFKPYEQIMEQNGVDKAAYMQNMIMWEQALATHPVETVKQIMQKFNVTPDQLGVAKSENEFDLDMDFGDNAGNEELESLKVQVQNLQQQVANQPVLAQLESFQKATDPSGNLKHPRFKEVAPLMGTLIQTGKAQTLEDAYTKAIRAVDNESSEPEQFGAVDVDQVRQKVAKSKRASKTVKSKGSRQDFSKMSVRDELTARLKA